jgi:RND family efflux transporter MFP subunit
MKKRSRWIVAAVAVLGAGAGGAWWWHSRAKAKPAAAAEVVVARKGDLAVRVKAAGVVEPEFVVEVKSKASGVVEVVGPQEGDRIAKGTLVVRIDPILERRKVTQADAALRIAQAGLSGAMERRGHSLRQLERESTLHKKGLVSAEAVDLVKKEAAVLAGEVRSASAQILRAREELQEAKDRLAETEIRAPIAGTVLERTVQPGQIVASGTNAVNGGTTLLKVADLSKMFVRVKVDEADVARIQPGLRAALTADALAGQTFEGKVARVSPQGKIESNVTVFEVLVELGDDGKRALRPAMTANVEIEVAKRAGAVLVPLRAVRTSKKEGGKVVVVEGQGPRVVQTGIADSRDIEIVGGLQEGERVVLPGGGAGGARDGQRPQGGAGGQNPMRNMRRMMGG